MSLAADSPIHSSSSDDFAATLAAELDTISDASGDPEEDLEEEDDGNNNFAASMAAELDIRSDASADPEEISEERDDVNDGDADDYEPGFMSVKRRKVELSQGTVDPQSSSSDGEAILTSGSSPKNDICPPHPGVYREMCVRCGQKVDDESGVAFGYIHKDLRLANDEIVRIREKDLKHLLSRRKLYLVLDLDHTLLNSTRLSDLSVEEGYLHGQKDTLPENLKSTLYRLERMMMMTKLRPFVHTFLKEANKLFEMYIYTMGERAYASEMAKLLDPANNYFEKRVIAQGDCIQKHQKTLDVVLGEESAVLILDDTEAVWGKHIDNLIVMERYHFFASSCKQFSRNQKSLSEQRSDESETDGQLATVLKVLQRIHTLFFDSVDNNGDVRQVLKTVRKEVLNGCKVVFTRVFPSNFPAEHHSLWKMAEQLGATCSTELDPSITHVISLDERTDKSRWAVKEKKFLVNPEWIVASKYLWQKQPEGNFPVSEARSK